MDIRAAFMDLEWHDAELLELLIDRRQPGERDEVVLTLRWPDERTQRMRFRNCYGLRVNLNFGIVAPESILTANCEVDTPVWKNTRESWARVGVVLPPLLAFSVETHTTGGLVQILAATFEFTDV